MRQEPVFPSNKSIAFDQDEIDRMWETHEEAIEDQPDEWNPGRLPLWPLWVIHESLERLSSRRKRA